MVWCGKGVKNMAEAKEKKKYKYNTVQNMVYMLRHWWKWNRASVLKLSLLVPLQVVYPLLGLLLPRTVIAGVASGLTVGALLLQIAGLTAGLAIATAMTKWLRIQQQGIGMDIRLQFLFLTFKKNLDMDYANAENPETHIKWEKTHTFCFNNNAGGEQFIQASISFCVNLCGLVLYAAMLTQVSPWLLLILFAISLLNYGGAVLQQRHEHKHMDDIARIENEKYYLFDQTHKIDAGKDIRVYGVLRWVDDLYANLLRQRLVISGQVARLGMGAGSLTGLLNLIRDGLAYAYIIRMVLLGTLSVADFTLYFGMIAGFSVWLDSLLDTIKSMNKYSLECNDFREFLEIEDMMFRGEGINPQTAVPTAADIELRCITYQYPGAEMPTLSNISLHIRAGERIAIVGRNGAGKTTLVKVLSGLYNATGGEVYINGTPHAAFDRDAYYDLFSILFQEFSFLPVSIACNVALRDAQTLDRERVADCLRQAGLLDKVSALPNGMDSLMLRELHEDAVDFSGGEKQRLILARALYKQAPIIVLDEPTAALDPIAESHLYEQYARMTEGRTSLFISHRLASTKFCDRILFIEGGIIVEEGTHEQLMALGGKYAEMFDIQSYYYKDHPDASGEEA